MKNKIRIILYIFLFSQMNVHLLVARKRQFDEPEESQKTSSNRKQERIIRFHYENEDLIDVINFMASQKGVNIVLPQGANAITSKVTMNMEDLLSVNEAWSVLNTMLDIAGYSLMPKGDMYSIIKTTPNITREPLPLFVGMNPDKLPDTDQRIRYIYYFTNIKASDADDSELITILKNLLPAVTSSYKVDTNSNAVIITGKADDIRGVMKIVLELDKVDFHETLEIIDLRYTSAKFISDLFNDNILKAANDFNRYRLDARSQTEATFFSKYIRIFPEERTNKLIVLGRPQAVNRIKDFIFKYLDIELESAQSILHVYQLQYLSADKMEAVLTRIVQSAQQGGSGQATVSGAATIGGIQKTFDEVIIKADNPASADRQYYGGNKLVVAARNDDWKVIEKLIQELDIPQPQVLLEVLIADLTIEDTRIIGSLLRNPAKIPLMGQTTAQAANMGQIIPNLDADGNPTTLQSDLLRLGFNTGGGANTASIAQVLSNQNPGSTFISLSDANGSTYNLLQLLQSFNNAKILSHPHVIATNNQQAKVVIGEMRLLIDEAVGSGGTTTTVKNKQEYAELTVKITPRISAANTVQLDIVIDVTDFVSTVDNSRINRHVQTIACVPDKDILAVGGLVKVSTTDGLNETPILSKIPILGYFFKNRTNDVAKTNLTVFISPTIIEPRLRSGVDEYTQQYISLTKSYARESSLFDSLRDPITRWFFKAGADTDEELDDFVAKDEFKAIKKREEITIDVTETQVTKKSRRKRKRRTNQKVITGQTQCATPEKPYNAKAQDLQNIINQDTTSPLEPRTQLSDPIASNSEVSNRSTKEISDRAPLDTGLQDASIPPRDPEVHQAPVTPQPNLDAAVKTNPEKIDKQAVLKTSPQKPIIDNKVRHDIKSSELSNKDLKKIKDAHPVLGAEQPVVEKLPTSKDMPAKTSEEKANELKQKLDMDSSSPLKPQTEANDTINGGSSASDSFKSNSVPVAHAKTLEEKMHELHEMIKKDSRSRL
jgi:general secretion pathway protein D